MASETNNVGGDGSRIIAVIPARYASVRFPGKPLASIAGKPMIQRVYERVSQATLINRIIVATDDERIRETVIAFGGEAMMTRGEHRCGTERVAEVAAHLSAHLGAGGSADVRATDPIYLNVQGDEPLIEPAALDSLAAALADDPAIQTGTLCSLIVLRQEILDPNVVKVVRDFDGDSLYFSRAPVPWVRAAHPEIEVTHMKHIGVYAFRRAALLEYAALPPGDLERIEQLEQLRWLENGLRMRVVECDYDPISVDVPEDIAKVEARLAIL
jgi:3-deoxy-manno-octulosonate cytidylyltransferase (CMP-KDO synthetase)